MQQLNPTNEEIECIERLLKRSEGYVNALHKEFSNGVSFKGILEGNAGDFVEIRMMEEDMMESLEQIYKEETDKELMVNGFVMIFERFINDGKAKLINPYVNDKELIQRKIQAFITAKEWLLGLHKTYQNYQSGNPIKSSANEPISKIETYLVDLKQAFNNEKDFLKAIEIINAFFSGSNNNTNSVLFVKNGNVKKLAFALGEIWRSQRNEIITYEYLQFCKQTFSIFKSQNLDKTNLFGNNLYKYSISKT